jgi:tetratricopeptide (TPR) repeat protein
MAAGVYFNLVKTDYDRALEEFNLAKTELHNDADLLSDIALVQMRQGDFDEALENYSKAAEVDPLNPSIHADRSLCLSFVRQFQEAEQSINRAIALDPSRSEWYNQKLWLYGSRYGDVARMLPVIQDALNHTDTLDFVSDIWTYIEFLPASSQDSLYSLMGLSSDELFDHFRMECRDRVDTGLYYGTVAHAYYNRGDTALMMAYRDSVRTVLEKDLQANPDDPHRASALGLVLAYSGSCEEAEKWGRHGEELLSVATCHW